MDAIMLLTSTLYFLKGILYILGAVGYFVAFHVIWHEITGDYLEGVIGTMMPLILPFILIGIFTFFLAIGSGKMF